MYKRYSEDSDYGDKGVETKVPTCSCGSILEYIATKGMPSRGEQEWNCPKCKKEYEILGSSVFPVPDFSTMTGEEYSSYMEENEVGIEYYI